MLGLFTKTLTAIALVICLAPASFAGDYDEKAHNLADTKLKEILHNSVVIEAVKAQNTAHAGLTQDDIDALDKQWRAGDADLIEPILGNDLSTFLTSVADSSGGLFSEIFVMDDKGLNVGQNSKTSDYWQGDEAKWQKTYSVGADALHISEVEFDESSQTYQVQISIPVVDGDTVIGATTFGVNAEMME